MDCNLTTLLQQAQILQDALQPNVCICSSGPANGYHTLADTLKAKVRDDPSAPVGVSAPFSWLLFVLQVRVGNQLNEPHLGLVWSPA